MAAIRPSARAPEREGLARAAHRPAPALPLLSRPPARLRLAPSRPGSPRPKPFPPGARHALRARDRPHGRRHLRAARGVARARPRPRLPRPHPHGAHLRPVRSPASRAKARPSSRWWSSTSSCTTRPSPTCCKSSTMALKQAPADWPGLPGPGEPPRGARGRGPRRRGRARRRTRVTALRLGQRVPGPPGGGPLLRHRHSPRDERAVRRVRRRRRLYRGAPVAPEGLGLADAARSAEAALLARATP